MALHRNEIKTLERTLCCIVSSFASVHILAIPIGNYSHFNRFVNIFLVFEIRVDISETVIQQAALYRLQIPVTQGGVTNCCKLVPIIRSSQMEVMN